MRWRERRGFVHHHPMRIVVVRLDRGVVFRETEGTEGTQWHMPVWENTAAANR